MQLVLNYVRERKKKRNNLPLVSQNKKNAVRLVNQHVFLQRRNPTRQKSSRQYLIRNLDRKKSCAVVSRANWRSGSVLLVHSHCLHLVGAIKLQPYASNDVISLTFWYRSEVPHWL